MPNEKISIREKIREKFDNGKISELYKEAEKAIVGEKETLDLLISALLAGGHIILDGFPGTAKTRMAFVMGKLFGLRTTKVQFSGEMTPDQLKGFEMPVPVISMGEMEQRIEQKIQTIVRAGPLVDAELFVADEINRANEEIPNSLLSTLQDKYFRVGEKSFRVNDLFTMVTTRNFIELSGIRELGFAFLDRLLFSAIATHPDSEEDECAIGCMPMELEAIKINNIYKPDGLIELRRLVREQKFLDTDDPIVKYIARLIRCSRPEPGNELMAKIENKYRLGLSKGVSSRTTQWFIRAAAIYVYCVLGENVILPDHIQYLAKPALRHHLVFEETLAKESMDAANLYIDELIKRVPIIAT